MLLWPSSKLDWKLQEDKVSVVRVGLHPPGRGSPGTGSPWGLRELVELQRGFLPSSRPRSLPASHLADVRAGHRCCWDR